MSGKKKNKKMNPHTNTVSQLHLHAFVSIFNLDLRYRVKKKGKRNILMEQQRSKKFNMLVKVFSILLQFQLLSIYVLPLTHHKHRIFNAQHHITSHNMKVNFHIGPFSVPLMYARRKCFKKWQIFWCWRGYDWQMFRRFPLEQLNLQLERSF